MKTIYTALIFLFTLTCYAQNGLEQAYYTQMLDINAQWAFHKNDCPKEQFVFA